MIHNNICWSSESVPNQLPFLAAGLDVATLERSPGAGAGQQGRVHRHPGHGKTMGKPWENHGKTIWTSYRMQWNQVKSHGLLRLPSHSQSTPSGFVMSCSNPILGARCEQLRDWLSVPIFDTRTPQKSDPQVSMFSMAFPRSSNRQLENSRNSSGWLILTDHY